jgi:3-oxoacyl-[acyl-carrier-protein] synthase-1
VSSQPLAIVGSGLVTGVGLSAPATCAAIRCAIDNFQETRFMDAGGEWIMGCEVPLEQPWRGTTKLVKMLAMALRECAETMPGVDLNATPIVLCLAEKNRPGLLPNLVHEVREGIQDELGFRLHPLSQLVTEGRVGVAVGLYQARQLIYGRGAPRVIIAGVDSLLVGPTLSAFEERERLLTSQNSNGFIPGEAAAAILVQAPTASDKPQLVCSGIGFGIEKATEDSEEPLRADGLVQAIKGALADAGCDMGDLDFRITDVSGSQYQFKEAALALSRILRKRKEEFDIWHPADCVGEVGAAVGGIMAAVIDAACRKAYSKGSHILFHLGNSDGKRVAMVCGFLPVGR